MLKLIKEKLHSGMGKDVVWTFTLQIVIMLCSFAINKLLSNRLSIDDFGQYNVIKRSVQVLSFVMLAGVGIALPRYIPLYRNGEEKRRILPLLTAALVYILGVTLVVVLLCIVFSGPMQHLIIGTSHPSPLTSHPSPLTLHLYIIAIAYAFVLALAQYAYAYYRGIGDFKWYNGTQLGVQLAIILPLVLLPVLTVQGVFTSWLLITLLLVAYYLGRELWHKRYALTTQESGVRSQESGVSSHLSVLNSQLLSNIPPGDSWPTSSFSRCQPSPSSTSATRRDCSPPPTTP